MKVSKISFLLLIDLLMVLFAYVLKLKTLNFVVVLTILSSTIVLWSSFKIDNGCLKLSSALLLYTIATQFGLVIPYVLLGRKCLDNYNDYTLRFLNSDYLVEALLLGDIAIIIFAVFKTFSKKKYSNLYKQDIVNELPVSQTNIVSKKMYVTGLCLMMIVLIYFAFNILNGGMKLFSTYEAFRNSSAYNSNLYSYILILFYVGTIYLAAAGRIMDHKIGWGIWLILVLVFALNGNKGEFLYALLTVLGLKGVEGQRISKKSIFIAMTLLFIVIPSITALRTVGVFGNLSSLKFNIVEAFSEMGMQIRVSVYVLEDLESNIYDSLFGQSYYLPVLNFIPFLKNETATGMIKSMYPGYGFSQVIESYLNFGVLGTLGYFGILGYFITTAENVVHNRVKLAYIGTITCILINATRNYFAFVPGQIIIVTIIYLFIKKIRHVKF